jgi:hypothetical protein
VTVRAEPTSAVIANLRSVVGVDDECGVSQNQVTVVSVVDLRDDHGGPVHTTPTANHRIIDSRPSGAHEHLFQRGDNVKFSIMIEPQFGATYQEQLAIALHAEQLGFEGLFRSDHFLTMGPDETFKTQLGPWPGPTDAWITLAGLAMQTSRIRLGTLMTSATFRAPGLLAVQVAQVDQMSGGRVELGLGTGWFEEEHRVLGIALPELRQRFQMLEEHLEIVTGLWMAPAGGSFSFSGNHYHLEDNPGLPKPKQSPRPPIIELPSSCSSWS